MFGKLYTKDTGETENEIVYSLKTDDEIDEKLAKKFLKQVSGDVSKERKKSEKNGIKDKNYVIKEKNTKNAETLKNYMPIVKKELFNDFMMPKWNKDVDVYGWLSGVPIGSTVLYLGFSNLEPIYKAIGDFTGFTVGMAALAAGVLGGVAMGCQIASMKSEANQMKYYAIDYLRIEE